MRPEPAQKDAMRRIFSLPRWFASLRAALIVGLGLILVLALISTSLGYLTLRNMQAGVVGSLADAGRIRDLGVALETEFLRARQSEAEFLASWRAMGFDSARRVYVEANQRYLEQARANLTEMEDLIARSDEPALQALAGDMMRLRPLLIDYEAAFQATITDISRRARPDGPDQEFDRVYRELDLATSNLADPASHSLLLDLRAAQDEFFRTGSDRAYDVASDVFDQLRDVLSRAPTAREVALLDDIEQFRRIFDELAASDRELNANLAVFRSVTEDVAVITRQISQSSNRGLASVRATLTATGERIGLVLLITAGLALSLAVFVAVVLIRRIIRPLNILTGAAGRIGRTDFNEPIMLRTADEFQVLADAFNAMNARLHETVSSLEDRVSERTIQLQLALDENDWLLQVERIRNQRQAALFRIGEHLAATIDEEEICRRIAAGLHDERLGYAYVAVFLIDEAGGDRVLRASIGLENLEPGLRLPPGSGISEEAVLSGRLCYTPNVTRAEHYVASLNRGSEVDIPLKIGDHIVGVLIVESRQPNAFDSDDFETLTAAAHQVGVALGRARLYTSLQRELAERRATEIALQRAKEEAETANQSKSMFLANMSHELRTPLNAIIGYSEMLQEDCADSGSAEFVPDLEKIRSAGHHLLGLINDILDISKIEAGKMDLHIEAFDVADMLGNVVNTVQPLVSQNRNTLQIEQDGEPGLIYADMTKVRQVLFNLLSNACKFTSQGTITLRTSFFADRDALPVDHMLALPSAAYCFEIRDNGIGMTDEQQARLFQPFTQADASTTRKYGGTGLGLAISRRFCQLMGGDISLSSRSGVGTSFKVWLPVDTAAVRAQAQAIRLSQPAATGNANQPTVLVIDDDPALIELIVGYLSEQGYRVLHSYGNDALAVARETRPDVITLDVIMPGTDGWAILATLKADPLLREIPVIMLTISDNEDLGYALGATDYLGKPIDQQSLVNVISRHLNGSADQSVLVIEDDAATRNLMRRTLERAGLTVNEAADGRAGLSRLEQHIPALILLDLMLPEVDGFHFVSELRRNPAWRKIPVIVITACDLNEAERSRLNGDIELILQKGAYSRDELLREVRELLSEAIRPA